MIASTILQKKYNPQQKIFNFEKKINAAKNSIYISFMLRHHHIGMLFNFSN
jgi:hypothetical protein